MQLFLNVSERLCSRRLRGVQVGGVFDDDRFRTTALVEYTGCHTLIMPDLFIFFTFGSLPICSMQYQSTHIQACERRTLLHPINEKQSSCKLQAMQTSHNLGTCLQTLSSQQGSGNVGLFIPDRWHNPCHGWHNPDLDGITSAMECRVTQAV